MTLLTLDKSFPIKFYEKNNYQYIHVDAQNKVHLMVPIIASGNQQIGTDNTCQSLQAIRQFFGFADKSVSALSKVNSYIKDLKNDLEMIDHLTFTSQEDKENLIAIYERKTDRLKQLILYKKLLQEKSVTKTVSGLYLGSTLGNYPNPILTILSQMSNLFAISLSTDSEDKYTKFKTPFFSVTRANKEKGQSETGLGHNLRANLSYNLTTLEAQIINDTLKSFWDKKSTTAKGTPTNKDEITPADDFPLLLQCLEEEIHKHSGLENVDLTSLWANYLDNQDNFNATQQSFHMRLLSYIQSTDTIIPMKENLSTFIFKTDEFSSCEDTLKEILAIIMRPTNPSTYKTINILESHSILMPPPPVKSASEGDIKSFKAEKEKFLISIQFFLAIINAHCYSQNLFEDGHQATNIAGIIEDTDLLPLLIDKIQEAINSNTPIESAIIKFINDHYEQLNLTKPLDEVTDSPRIIEHFKKKFNVVKDNNVRDEFLLLLDKKGCAFEHGYNICITMEKYVEAMGNPKLYNKYFGEAQGALSKGTFDSLLLDHINESVTQDTSFTPTDTYTIEIPNEKPSILYQIITSFVALFRFLFGEKINEETLYVVPATEEPAKVPPENKQDSKSSQEKNSDLQTQDSESSQENSDLQVESAKKLEPRLDNQTLTKNTLLEPK